MDVSAAESRGLPDDLFFSDGLGDRLLVRDSRGHATHECLSIRPELTAVPAFEFALHERIWTVEKFDHPAFLTVRNILRLPGRLTSISLLHDMTDGERLSEILERTASTGQAASVAATTFLMQETLNGLAELHRHCGDLAHGALAPERIVVDGGTVRIADYVFGPAIEQLRFTTERYWKELRVAVPVSAGGTRLDRRVDVAQAALVAVAMFAGRPLRDTEHLGALGDVLSSISVPQPIRSWLLRALHMDSRRVFVHAGEASRALDDAMVEAGVRPSAQELASFVGGRVVVSPFTAPNVRHPVRDATPLAVTVIARPAPEMRAPAAAPQPRRDARPQPHDAPRTYERTHSPVVGGGNRMSDGFRKFLLAAVMIAGMTGAFTAAQFIPAPEWMYSKNGTLVIESSPQGVKVSVNGQPQGVTPLTLKVESGIHEVELHGPGKPKIFKVHVTRGDRVAQYIEFTGRR